VLGIADESALRDFEDEAMEGEVCLLGSGADVFGEAEIGELGEGDIHREGEMVGDVFGRSEDCTEKLACERAVKAGLFGEGDELIRRDEAALGMLPSGKGLEAAKKAGAKFNEGLEVRNDLVVFERPTQIVGVFGSHEWNDTTVQEGLIL
jgi:hypothetical protein